MSTAAGGDVPPECVDQPELANCELIVYARLCSNSYYSSFCCASCARHSQGNDRFGRLGWRWERRREGGAFCWKHWSRFGGLGLKNTSKTHPTERLPRPKSTSPECRDKEADSLGHVVQGLCSYTAAVNTEHGNVKPSSETYRDEANLHVSHLILPTCLK